jgi:hypothetical protein
MLKIGTLNADKCLVIDESIFDLTNGLTRDIPLVERLNGVSSCQVATVMFNGHDPYGCDT